MPQAGRFGNAGVNTLDGPGTVLHHASVTKRFRVLEGLQLEYVCGVSNLLNTPHFQFPRSDISAARPGEITSARTANMDNEKAGQRIVEMTLRLRW